MSLTDKYHRAIDLRVANPEMTWDEIAGKIDVTPRQLRRVRNSEEWKEAWESADKDDMVDALRRKALSENNAALFRTYFEVTGTLEPDMMESFLRMTDEEAMDAAKKVYDWYGQQST